MKKLGLGGSEWEKAVHFLIRPNPADTPAKASAFCLAALHHSTVHARCLPHVTRFGGERLTPRRPPKKFR